MRDSVYYVYIITNKYHTTFYTGVTNNLIRRITEHKMGEGSEFVRRYNLGKLVYYEVICDIRHAITREKQIKAGPRKRKIELITKINPDWNDLYEEWFSTE